MAGLRARCARSGLLRFQGGGAGVDPNDEVDSVISAFREKDPGIARVFERAHGYAVFPKVGKGGLALTQH